MGKMFTETDVVLLVRNNARHEVVNTEDIVEWVSSTVAPAKLVTLANPQTETLKVLCADPAFEKVILYPDPDEPSPQLTPQLKTFLSRQGITASVLVCAHPKHYNYLKHLYALLQAPGPKFLVYTPGRLTPLYSPAGFLRACQIVLRSLTSRFGALPARLQSKWKQRFLSRSIQRGNSPPPPVNPSAIRKILWIRLDHIGDVLMSAYALASLRQSFPDAQIDVLVQERVAPLIKRLRGDFRPIRHQAKHLVKNTGKADGLFRTLALLRRLRRSGYDMAIDSRGDNYSRLVAYLTSAKVRIGPLRGRFEPDPGVMSFLLTHAIPLDTAPEDSASQCLWLIQKAGINETYSWPDLGVQSLDTGCVGQQLKAAGCGPRFAVVHSNATDVARTWTQSGFAAVATHLRDHHDLDVVFVGGPGDRDYIADIMRGTSGLRMHNMAGSFKLEALPDVIGNALVMVAVDSGPMHIAAMVKTPVVSLFLPWHAVPHGPRGQRDHMVIAQTNYDFPDLAPKTNTVMKNGIPVPMVTDMIDKVLSTARPTGN